MIELTFSQRGKTLEQIAAEIEKGMPKATQQNTEAVAEAARRRVKVRTGYTKSTIAARQVGENAGEVSAGGGAQALEYGGRYSPPQPFMGPAIDEVTQEALERIQGVVEGAISD